MTFLIALALQSGFEEKLDALLPKLRHDDPDDLSSDEWQSAMKRMLGD